MLFCAACTQQESVQYPAPNEKRASGDALFVPVDARITHIRLTNPITETPARNGQNDPSLYFGGGVAVLDFNRDSLPDLCFTERQGGIRLYRNQGGFQFQEVTESAGIGSPLGEKSAVTVIDINADGWDDLYVCRTGPNPATRKNLLYVNNRRGGFTERAREFGLDDGGLSHQALFFDADLDGDLDCFVVNAPDSAGISGRFYNNEGLRPTSPQGKSVKYTPVPGNAGINPKGLIASALVSDLNGDFLPDLLFSEYGSQQGNQVFFNQAGKKGFFTERPVSILSVSPNRSRGIDLADVDRNGQLDIVTLESCPLDLVRRKLFLPAPDSNERFVFRNTLQFGFSDGSWAEAALAAGIGRSDNSWAPLLQDFDLDGFPDLFVSTGSPRDYTHRDLSNDTVSFKEFPGGAIPNACFRNRGDGSFEDVSHTWGFVQFTASTGAASADLDRDGDLDIITNNIGAFPTIYRNRASERQLGHWIRLTIRGADLNPMALGAKISVYLGNTILKQELYPVRGFLSSSSPVVFFGLGDSSRIDSIVIQFPEGKRLVLPNVPANNTVIADIRQANKNIINLESAQVGAPYLEWVETLNIPVRNPAKDAPPPLLPYWNPLPGPVLAVGDVNGDALEDFFYGNTRGGPGALFIQKNNGTFQRSPGLNFSTQQSIETAGARFFDLDLDGDDDLMLTFTGENLPSPAEAYRVRLFRNDGRGKFSIFNEGIPELKTPFGPICTADYDGDGDLDVFLGGTTMPGQYGTISPGQLLINNKGIFSVAEEEITSEWSKCGAMTALVWNDFNGDGYGELVVACPWQPLRIFALRGGKLVDISGDFGLNARQAGIWRDLIALDTDGDGDNDLVAANVGWNAGLQADRSHPLKQYFSDLNRDGHADPIVTEGYEGFDLPWIILDDLLAIAPQLQPKLKNYEIYSKSTIYNISSQQESPVGQVNQLASGIFKNNGGRFSFEPLPFRAQWSPVLAVVGITPGDSIAADLILGGNFTGFAQRLDFGTGLPTVLFIQDSVRQFNILEPRQSGFNTYGQVTGLKVVSGSNGKRYLIAAFRDQPPKIYRIRQEIAPSRTSRRYGRIQS